MNKEFFNLNNWPTLLTIALVLFITLYGLYILISSQEFILRDFAAVITSIVAIQAYKIAKENLDYKRKEHEASQLDLFYDHLENHKSGSHLFTHFKIKNNAPYHIFIEGISTSKVTNNYNDTSISVSLSKTSQLDQDIKITEWKKGADRNSKNGNKAFVRNSKNKSADKATYIAPGEIRNLTISLSVFAGPVPDMRKTIENMYIEYRASFESIENMNKRHLYLPNMTMPL